MNDIERAKELFQTGEYTCVLVKDDSVYTSATAGISPMLGFIGSGIDLNGFSAADKIVGRAAAMLFVLAGVKEVFTAVLSKQAEAVFIKHGIRFSCDTLTEAILNRSGTDLCPMEKAVGDIEEPPAAIEAIKKTLELLKSRNTGDAK